MAKDLRISLKVDDKASKPIEGIKSSFDKLQKSVVGNEKAIERLKKSVEASKKVAADLFSVMKVGFVAATGAALAFGAAMFSAIKQQADLNKSLKVLDNNSQLFESLRIYAGKAGIETDKLSESIQQLSAGGFNAKSTEKLIKLFADLGTKLPEDKVNQLKDAFIELRAKVKGGGMPELEKFTKLAGVSMEDLAKAANVSMSEIQKRLKDGTVSAKTFYDALASRSGKPVGQVGLTFADSDILSQITNIETTLSNTKLNIYKAIFGDGKEGAKALKDFNEQLQKLTSIESLTSKFKAFKQLVDDLKPAIALVAGGIVGGLLPGLVSMTVAAWAAVPALWAVYAPLLPFIAAGAAVGLAIYRLIDNWNALSGGLEIVWRDIKKIFTGMYDSFKSFEGNLIDGMWNGIKAGFNSLMANFTELIGLLPDTVKKILGIHSPSKVFYKIGANIMDGLNNGINKQSKKSITLISTLTKAMNKEGEKLAPFNHFVGLNIGSTQVLPMSDVVLEKVKKTFSGLISRLEKQDTQSKADQEAKNTVNIASFWREKTPTSTIDHQTQTVFNTNIKVSVASKDDVSPVQVQDLEQKVKRSVEEALHRILVAPTQP